MGKNTNRNRRANENKQLKAAWIATKNEEEGLILPGASSWGRGKATEEDDISDRICRQIEMEQQEAKGGGGGEEAYDDDGRLIIKVDEDLFPPLRCLQPSCPLAVAEAGRRRKMSSDG